MDQTNYQIFVSLISGLVGSLIGGLVTFLVTRYSIKRTTEEAMGIEKKKRGWVKEDQEKSAISALLIETEEIDKNFLFVRGSIRNVDLYVKKILTTKCGVLYR